MAVSLETLGIDKMSVDDRLELIDKIWDSLEGQDVDQVDPKSIPEWHWRILDERLKDMKENPDDVIPWEDVKRRLEARS